MATTVSVALGVLNVTVNTTGLPSVAEAAAMLIVAWSFAGIVAVPDAVVLAVLPEVTVPFNTKVSAPSAITSSMVGTFTVAVVCPAKMVMVCVVVV